MRSRTRTALAALIDEQARQQGPLSPRPPAPADMPAIRDGRARMREAVDNVRLEVARVSANATVRGAIGQEKMRVIGAYHETGSGAVDFLISEEDLAPGVGKS